MIELSVHVLLTNLLFYSFFAIPTVAALPQFRPFQYLDNFMIGCPSWVVNLLPELSVALLIAA